MSTDQLEVRRAAELGDQPARPAYLIDSLWAERGVGIIGGEPKCGKSFLALDLAVAVASGTPCLGRFAVRAPGRVLLFAAEDALSTVHQRLQGITQVAGLGLEHLDLYLITSPTVRLDLERDRQRLHNTVAHLRPRLLVLDPFVRLHRVDENQVQEVAPLLAFLRQIERTFTSAVCLVHHLRKGASHLRSGQALRGSSELHAWGDSNLYLSRSRDRLRLSIEHRAAAAPADLYLQLPDTDGPLALRLCEQHDSQAACSSSPRSPSQRVLRALQRTGMPMTLAALRAAAGMRTQTLCETLTALAADGVVRKSEAGTYQLA
jgi:RecA-family ATPase